LAIGAALAFCREPPINRFAGADIGIEF
jgi:hypothetical protein